MKKIILWICIGCAVALVLCGIYYIQHPEEADAGIVATMDNLDNA